MLTGNFILLENVAEVDIVSVLSNLTNIYADTGFTDGIELSKYNSSDNMFLVTFTLENGKWPDFNATALIKEFLDK